MALKNRDNNKQYLKVKDGKFFIGKDETQAYEELEGLVTNIRYKDEEYEGTPLRKFVMVISDGDDNYELGINVENSNYSTLISFLKAVDLTRTITLHPKVENTMRDGKEVARRSILVSQDGKFAKGYFTKDNTHGLPEWNIVKVGNKKVTDKSEYLAFLEKFVVENYIPQVAGSIATSKSVIQSEDEVETVASVKAGESKAIVKEESVLPWD